MKKYSHEEVLKMADDLRSRCNNLTQEERSALEKSAREFIEKGKRNV